MRLNLSVRIFFIVSTCLLNLQVIVLSQTPASDARPGTASISGRVNIGGQPAAGKRVLVADVNTGWGTPDIGSGGGGTQGRKYFSVVTDADGQYRLTGLPAGAYQVSLNLLGAYVPVSQDGQRSRSITLNEGEEARNIDFMLTRGGVITGHLTDAGGTPIIGASVLANTIDKDGVRRSQEWNLLHNGKGMTDDRGAYRIYGLPPGRYRVSADGSAVGPTGGTFTDKGKRYPRTYHPNVTDEKQAAIVEVKEVGEVSGIDINLGEKRSMYEVTGRVIDSETGTPLSQSGVRVSCRRVDSDGNSIESFAVYAQVDPQGNFRFAGLTSGRYGLELSFLSVDKDPYSGRAIFEVKQEKVSGLEIKTEREIVIKGVVVFDNRSNPAMVDWLPYANIGASVTHPSYTGYYGSSHIGADGSFSLSGLKPGVVTLLTSSVNLKPLPYILRVEKDGVERKDGIKVKSGEKVTGVRVVMTYGSGGIRGRINVVGGALPEGAEFRISARHKDAFNYYGRAEVDSKGRFVIEGLIAGEYEVDASADPQNGTGRSFYASQRIRVTDGVETPITLTLDLGQKKKETER
jgi:protocatechuate 3,4-dioxygenase beta subunit